MTEHIEGEMAPGGGMHHAHASSRPARVVPLVGIAQTFGQGQTAILDYDGEGLNVILHVRKREFTFQLLADRLRDVAVGVGYTTAFDSRSRR